MATETVLIVFKMDDGEMPMRNIRKTNGTSVRTSKLRRSPRAAQRSLKGPSKTFWITFQRNMAAVKMIPVTAIDEINVRLEKAPRKTRN